MRCRYLFDQLFSPAVRVIYQKDTKTLTRMRLYDKLVLQCESEIKHYN